MRPRQASSRERGAVAVEFAIAVPILLIIVLGGLHIGRVLSARHRLADAVGYAARAAMIATPPGQAPNAGTVNATVTSRMSGVKECTSVTSTMSYRPTPPYRSILVTATCKLVPPFGSNLLGNLGMNSVTATASMPLN